MDFMSMSAGVCTLCGATYPLGEAHCCSGVPTYGYADTDYQCCVCGMWIKCGNSHTCWTPNYPPHDVSVSNPTGESAQEQINQLKQRVEELEKHVGWHR